ncbi:class I SAM-dependent methyltransferase [Streptomyces sp. CNQ-509]|uniref:class I SAM-dependent methyltransferase n=1 Tax=Streptomyces sp. CNQ-509 TaxID=444103 RepID=UPI0020A6AD67|nr:class I SAM-dependent methyltransferase [Streptomyces sp. CNQ-509]
MRHEDPLAYAVGMEGIALVRSFTGEYDRAFVAARLGGIRRLLGDEALAGAGVDVARVSTVEGYRIWSETYDGPNTAFDLDEPVVGAFLDPLPPGLALDAACGTGRMATLLAARGHRTLGVDSSPEMLARARKRLPEGDFRLGGLDELPVADGAVDVVVCSLALTHVPDLGPVLAEFARVLRPGGHLVTSDVHPERVALGSVPAVRLPDGGPARVETYRHAVGDYVRAALAAGLDVLGCEEPGAPAAAEATPAPAPATDPGPWEAWRGPCSNWSPRPRRCPTPASRRGSSGTSGGPPARRARPRARDVAAPRGRHRVDAAGRVRRRQVTCAARRFVPDGRRAGGAGPLRGGLPAAEAGVAPRGGAHRAGRGCGTRVTSLPGELSPPPPPA